MPCIHFYLCICAFLSSSKLTCEFHNLLQSSLRCMSFCLSECYCNVQIKFHQHVTVFVKAAWLGPKVGASWCCAVFITSTEELSRDDSTVNTVLVILLLIIIILVISIKRIFSIYDSVPSVLCVAVQWSSDVTYIL